MPDPIILGSIVIYASKVVLKDKTTAFSVVKYSTPEIGFKCRVPFSQTPDVEGDFFVRPEKIKDAEGKETEVPFPNPTKPGEKSPFPPIDRNAPNTPVRVSDPGGECDVVGSFVKYEFKEGHVVWEVVNQEGKINKALRGRLSEIFRHSIG